MNPRINLLWSLVLVAGCSDPMDLDGGDATASQSNGTSQTADSDAAPTTGTDDATTATEGTTAATTATTEQGGSQGASQSGTGGPQDTGDAASSDATGVSDTGEGTCMGKLGPAPVVLGGPDDLATPGAYAVLAKAAITNVPGTKIDGGHVGVSPAAASSITGFALVLAPPGMYATSPALEAPFRVYAADYTAPTPILLTTAVLAMQAAYTDAASRIPTDHLNLEGGDLGGLTLAPGIYTWGTTVLIPDDVTLAGCEDDVWIFQISGDLDVSTDRRVLLAGGAQARNVFWQVAGQATLHVGAHLEGIVLSKTGITLQTKASLHGRAYAQTMVALDKNAVTSP